MRIYINNFNLDILNDISVLFKEYMTNSETYIELYTSEGIYHIQEKNIYFLDTCDKDIKMFDNYYNNFTLIVDPSFFKKNTCSSIHGDTHLALQTRKTNYKINTSSEIQMVIKHILNEDKFIPNDIYFETEKDIDINELFIKTEIIEFLSVLN
jgi:hypothetical protein